MSASELKERWLQRKLSLLPLDQSGVWRFRELLPALNDSIDAITLREGNTPLYQLQRCARIAGVQTLFAKHQGMNPTGSFKDTGMTSASSFANKLGLVGSRAPRLETQARLWQRTLRAAASRAWF